MTPTGFDSLERWTCVNECGDDSIENEVFAGQCLFAAFEGCDEADFNVAELRVECAVCGEGYCLPEGETDECHEIENDHMNRYVSVREGIQRACQECGEDEYPDAESNTCMSCDILDDCAKCGWRDETLICLNCEAGYVLDIETGECLEDEFCHLETPFYDFAAEGCVEDCGIGRTPQNGICHNCVDTFGAGPDTCVSCEADAYDVFCVECPEGYWIDDDTGYCTQDCPEGATEDGCELDEEDNVIITECVPGLRLVNNVCILPCDIGTYWNTDSAACEDVAANCIEQTIPDVCDLCEGGAGTLEGTAECFYQCPCGYYMESVDGHLMCS